MKIRHDKYGDVDGVAQTGVRGFNRWKKEENGRVSYFNSFSGWSEVKEPKYVDVTSRVTISGEGRDLSLVEDGGKLHFRYSMTPQYHFEKARMWERRHDLWAVARLPEADFWAVMASLERDCLILKKEEK